MKAYGSTRNGKSLLAGLVVAGLVAFVLTGAASA